MRDFFKINLFTFMSLFAANTQFRGGLNELFFEWHNKTINNLIFEKKIGWFASTNYPKDFDFINEQKKKFYDSLSVVQKQIFEAGIKSFLGRFSLSDDWFGSIADFVITRYIVAPLGDTGIRRNVSAQSLRALAEFEVFQEAHYFPKTDEMLSNFNKYAGFRESYYLPAFVKDKLRKRLPVERFKREVQKVFRVQSAGRKAELPAKGRVPELKYSLTDEDVARKLHPEFKEDAVKIKKEVLGMEKLRERLTKLP